MVWATSILLQLLKKNVKRPSSLPALHCIGLAATGFSASLPALETVILAIRCGGVAGVVTPAANVSVDEAITHELRTNHKDLESWLGQIGESVAVAAETVTVAAMCGSLQFVASSVFPVFSCTNSEMPAILRGGPPLVRARNVAVMSGVYTCINSVMRRSRGKEDVQTSLVAGFGAGFMGALMYGAKGRSAIAHGVCIALFMAGVNKIMENNSHEQADGVLGVNTSGKLSNRKQR